jgi:hypothetical protein
MLACVCLLCALGLASGIAVAGGVSAAGAADDPVPTTTEPVPDPDPAPIPAPAPAPKPRPKPAPAPRPTVTPRPTNVSSTPAPVVDSSPAVPTRPAKPKPEVKTRVAHKKKPHTKRKLQPKPSTSLPKIVTPKHPRSGVLGTQTAATLSSGGSVDFASLLIVGMFAFAIACFGIAAIPAVYVPWRPAAYFIAHRNLDIAIAGLGFLLLAGFLVLLVGV